MTAIILSIIAFTSFICATAFIAQRGLIPKKLIHNPAIYTLSLGSYAGAWAIFGALDFAQRGGYIYLAFYFGTSALFLFSPLFLLPLLNLTSTYKLRSLADLFSFRYSSQAAGVIVTLGTLLGVLPLMAIQLEILIEAASVINANSFKQEFNTTLVEIVICGCIATFTLLFCSNNRQGSHYNQGLVFSLAVQSAVKLIVFLALAGIAIYTVFGSPQNLETWLNYQPEKLDFLNKSLMSNNVRTLVLIFFAAALAMPHMFHLAFNENATIKSIRQASWGFPLYMLLLSLTIFPILWATERLDLQLPAHFSALALGYLIGHPALSVIVFLALFAAMIGSISVITLAVASMCLNHLVLPFASVREKIRIFQNAENIKRSLMLTILILTYISYVLSYDINTLNGYGYAAYTAAFQFLPGIVAVLYWPRGNRLGLISGLCVGFGVWAITILLPLSTLNTFGLQPWLTKLLDLGGETYWFLAAAASLGANMLTFGLVSLISYTDEEQHYVARICSQDDLGRPRRQQLAMQSVDDFIHGLKAELGEEITQREVFLALSELSMDANERRPFALRLLRRQLESNFSGLFGPTVARQIVAKNLPYQQGSPVAREDIQLIEHRLEESQNNLTGLAAELNTLRRYHRNTIETLPIGICGIDDNKEILLWNSALAELSKISTQDAVGSHINSLEKPWRDLLLAFADSEETHLFKAALDIDEQQRWFTLHKTALIDEANLAENQTLLIEEVTQLVLLEKELLHNERLASIGRLAAGVAHEIGNPITGIACLAQNLKYDSDSPAINNTAKDILAQTERVTRIVQSLVNFSHAGTHGKRHSFESLNLYLCIDDAIHLLSLNNHHAKQLINNQLDKELFVNGDMQSLLQVFINLLKNALQAVADDGEILLSSENFNHSIEIHISDNGEGIAKDIQDHIFEPFFTTKDPGEGTGLGLALVYSIIDEHHGSIQLLSPLDEQSNRGTRFIIRLPKAPSNEALLS